MIEFPIWFIVIYFIFGVPIYIMLWIFCCDKILIVFDVIIDKFREKFKRKYVPKDSVYFHISKYSTTLEDCPIGLFVSENTLCLKTEYGNNEGRIDCYIVSSGEFFWGNSKSVDELRKEIVYPVTRYI